VDGCSSTGIMGSDPARGMAVCSECCVLSGRGLCDGPITCPEVSPPTVGVILCDLETSTCGRGLHRAVALWKKKLFV
jgi:hypothetical protein